MNKRVAIVTLPGYFNYGNKLQNYALNTVLNKLNFEVETLIINQKRSSRISKTFTIYRIKSIFKIFPNENIKKIFAKIVNKNTSRIQKSSEEFEIDTKRENIFKQFSENYLNEINIDLRNQRIDNSYDYFVTGSDQVWNPIYFPLMDNYFLTFAKPNQRLSYAASFSVESIPIEYIKDYNFWLQQMKGISVREEQGASIVKSISGRDAEVHVDPTLLLTKEEWLEISNKAANRPDTAYILTYFLGGPSLEVQNMVKKMAEENKMEVINLAVSSELDTYETGPSEFIDYINNASVLLTDSFHGVVFSIIMQTPFIVFERKHVGASMYSRIDTLLDKFNMHDREFKNIGPDIFEMDFSETYKVLDKEYQKSINYLDTMLRD